MADPAGAVERIKAAWPEKAEALDRLFNDLAERAEQLAGSNDAFEINLVLRGHRGQLKESFLPRRYA